MASEEGVTAGERTAASMHSTAERLEVAEALLHRSAERSPDAATRGRLHRLGDAVTAEARDIDQRADRLPVCGAPRALDGESE
jgi:hypothetical protein